MTQRYRALLAALFASLLLTQAPAHADSLEDVVKRARSKSPCRRTSRRSARSART